jgi:hypothetical protein
MWDNQNFAIFGDNSQWNKISLSIFKQEYAIIITLHKIMPSYNWKTLWTFLSIWSKKVNVGSFSTCYS